jgi:hypothetical protein
MPLTTTITNATGKIARTTFRYCWQKVTKDWLEENCMNKALCKWFLSLFSTTTHKSYQTTLLQNSNRGLGETRKHLYWKFGLQDEVKIEQNKDRLKAPWNITNGFEVLKGDSNDGIVFLEFIDAVIDTANMLNIRIAVIVKTKHFKQEYQE